MGLPVDLAASASPSVPHGAVLVVPLGSTEQHGAHLPLGTDSLIADALARRLVQHLVASRADRAVLAPVLPYGASGEHEGFPGTLSIGTDALAAVLVELVRSALPPAGDSPFRSVVLVSGHGGNADAVRRAVRVLHDDGRPVFAWSPRVPGADAHAGRTETSLLLALAPDQVGPMPWPTGDSRPIDELLAGLRSYGLRAVVPGGVLGDPAGATAEEGRALLDTLATDLATAVDGWLT